jgi:hypothetical protein
LKNQPINSTRGLETLVILMDTQDHSKMHEHLDSNFPVS